MSYLEEDDYSGDSGGESFPPIPIGSRGNSVYYLKTEDVIPRIVRKVKELSELLNLDYDETLIALHHHSWNIETTQNKFFEDATNKLRENCGIVPTKTFPLNMETQMLCPICFEKKSLENFDNVNCGHCVCKDCWEMYIKNKVIDYNAGAFFKCPFEKCNLIIRESFIRKYISEKDKDLLDLYNQKICRSFCEDNKTIKHCPSPGCKFCVENENLTRFEITCVGCNTIFCFRCGKEAHTPCTCKQIGEWDTKSSSESENLRWIQVNTKMCPKCRKPIEKNQGCNHMTCRSNGCNYEFCWLCLGDWKEHGNETGGFYKCNKYEKLSTEEKEKNRLKEIDKEKSILEKYIFYFERYQNNKHSQEKAKESLNSIDDKIKLLHTNLKLETSDLQFLTESAEYLVEARRVLKYSYVYGFYLTEKKEKDLFEFNQSDFERNCDLLHGLIEKNLTDFFVHEEGRKMFHDYKQKMNDLSQATKKFMLGFLNHLESGLLSDRLIQIYK